MVLERLQRRIRSLARTSSCDGGETKLYKHQEKLYKHQNETFYAYKNLCPISCGVH